MVLKEWSKLRQLYKETSKQMGRASWFPHHKGLLLGIWAACISVILFSVLIVWSFTTGQFLTSKSRYRKRQESAALR